MSYSEILRLFLPRYCVLCNAQVQREINICADCYAELPRIQFSCERCGSVLDEDQSSCANCLQGEQPFDRAITVFEYRRPIDYLITSLKFADNLACAEVLARLLFEELRIKYANMQLPEVIIPVPLHNSRLEERGFNQVLEIAKIVAKHLKITIDKHSCVRNKNTSPQAMLSASERIDNVKKAFTFHPKHKYQHVAVLDDVITTGNTINEVCSVIKQAGVKRIDVWSCARAVSVTPY